MMRGLIVAVLIFLLGCTVTYAADIPYVVEAWQVDEAGTTEAFLIDPDNGQERYAVTVYNGNYAEAEAAVGEWIANGGVVQIYDEWRGVTQEDKDNELERRQITALKQMLQPLTRQGTNLEQLSEVQDKVDFILRVLRHELKDKYSNETP
jgi:hypothetical protein